MKLGDWKQAEETPYRFLVYFDARWREDGGDGGDLGESQRGNLGRRKRRSRRKRRGEKLVGI